MEGDLAEVESRTQGLRDERSRLHCVSVDEDELLGLLERFGPLWVNLKPDERHELVALVIKEVKYNGQTGEVEILFNEMVGEVER